MNVVNVLDSKFGAVKWLNAILKQEYHVAKQKRKFTQSQLLAKSFLSKMNKYGYLKFSENHMSCSISFKNNRFISRIIYPLPHF